MRFNDSQIDGLVNLRAPKTAADLQQLLCGANWLRISLPGYAAVVDRLQSKLKQIQRDVGSSKKTKLKSVALTWTEEDEDVFRRLKTLLRKSVTLSHLREDPDWTLCLHTDASDRHCVLF